ncbi:MAG: FKBP-type peptidyl-prolyl cis-trans isomerase [Bacteroidetes bacterium]|nr:FKBP-type peptidyl-prolyl cis-trans isomerase [Bacteroidota bacterium]
MKFFKQLTGKALLCFLLVSSTVFFGFSQEAAFQKTSSGLRYKLIKTIPNAPKPAAGDVVELAMIYKNARDSVLFDNSKGQYNFTYVLENSSFPGDFNEALKLFGTGDSATFLLKADSFYLQTLKMKKVPAFVKKGSDLTFNVRVISVTSNAAFIKKQMAQVQEQNAKDDKLRQIEADSLKNYISHQKITVTPSPDGLYYISLRDGNGPSPVMGNKVVINYKGSYLTGDVFDSSYDTGMPFEFKLGSHSVIKGLEEGVKLMKKGGKARLIIPSSLGYGANPAGDIPPFTSLIYEVELLEVK